MITKQSNFNPVLNLSNKNYEQRKYSILEYINSLSADYSKELKKQLPEILQINRCTLSNWLNAPINSSIEIPSIKLAIISKILQVPMEKLINVKIQTFSNPLPQIFNSNSILHQTGLVK